MIRGSKCCCVGYYDLEIINQYFWKMSIFSVHIIRQKYVKNEKHFQMTIHDSGYKVWHYLSFKKNTRQKETSKRYIKRKVKN